MVKVIGPLGGFDASGSLAGSIVFSKWKGRNYVRRLVKPSNPKSGGQVGVRAMFKFLSQNWAALAAPDKATWDAGADSKTISAFNEYMSKNQARWRNFLAPGQATPITEGDAVGAMETWTATAGVRQITLLNQTDLLNQNWGRLIFKGATGFATSFSNCIGAVLLNVGATPVNFVDTPLIAGTYFYNARNFSADGVLGAQLGEVTATVV